MTFRSNKKLGNSYEREVCELLSRKGYWVHRIEEKKSGAQPFDVIAVKDGKAYAIDCKTLNDREKWFPLSRLENNQIYAFDKWLNCGNSMPLIFVKYKEQTLVIEYGELLEKKKVNVNEIIDKQRYSDSRF